MELLISRPAAAALALALVGTACVKNSTTPYRVDIMGGAGRAAAVAPPAPAPPVVRTERARRVGNHQVLRLLRPAPCGRGGEEALGAIAYMSLAPGPKSWVVVLPIWGSSSYPPRKLVSWFTHGKHRTSTNVLWVQNPGRTRLMDYESMEAAGTEADFMAAVDRSAACIEAASDDARAWVSWIQEQPDTDPRRIGIVGCSIGAIVASLTMGRDPRLSAGAFAMGGGHLEEIFAKCYGEEAKVRAAARERFGWDDRAFLQAVRGPLSAVDPVRFAGNIDPASVLFIDAGRDACIPQDARDELWEAMGRPQRVTLGYGHKKAFLTMTFLGFDRTTEHIVEFLEGRLSGPVDLSAGKPVPHAGAQAQ